MIPCMQKHVVHANKACAGTSRARCACPPVPCVQEHVGEYGVHWNFFASVAMVALLSHAVRVPPRCLPALAAMVTCIHQDMGQPSKQEGNARQENASIEMNKEAGQVARAYGCTLDYDDGAFWHMKWVELASWGAMGTMAHVALSYGGLGAWGLKEERDMSSLVDMNKEGLVSVLGYWALYLWGAAFATASAGTLQVNEGWFPCWAVGLRVGGPMCYSKRSNAACRQGPVLML
eukprot:scaffold127476_cov27-Tisochrysis_lutea.AAC.1